MVSFMWEMYDNIRIHITVSWYFSVTESQVVLLTIGTYFAHTIALFAHVISKEQSLHPFNEEHVKEKHDLTVQFHPKQTSMWHYLSDDILKHNWFLFLRFGMVKLDRPLKGGAKTQHIMF